MTKTDRGLTPWSRVLGILGKSRGARLLAVGVFLMFTGAISVYLSRAAGYVDYTTPGTYFLMVGFILIMWGAQRYLEEK